jgi:3-keto-5-aminohexanoate cleavage enzyme
LSLDERIGCLDAGPEMASLNMGSMLRTIGSAAGTMFSNPRPDIEQYMSEMLRRNIKPEMEIYHHGMFREVENLIEKGLVKKPYYCNFVIGMAYQGAVAATPANLITLIQLLPTDAIFNCSAIGRAQLPMTTLSVLLGGHVRVGLEDNVYFSRGELAKSNAQLVARSVHIIRELGFEIASPDEARQILGLAKKE